MKRWLLPFIFLVLAAIACDSPYYDPPRVLGVLANPDTAGQVYAVVGTTETRATYLSHDYGRTWQPSSTQVTTGYTEGFAMRGDDLYRDGMVIWSFPRSTFRFFFLSDDDRQYFALPGFNVSASEVHDTLYVGMGTEGVLTITGTNNWYLSAEGITQLKPLPLTITEPPTLAGIIALALLIPPLPMIHAYLLSRVWLYALPGKQAWRAALLATLLLTLLAMLAIIIWLTDVRTDYYPVVAVMSFISVFVGSGVSLILIPPDQAWSLAIRAGLVSLIVPLGVASVWWGWLFILPLVASYALFHWGYTRELRKAGLATPSLVNSLALRSLVILITFAAFVLLIFFGFGNRGIGILLALGMLIFGIYIFIRQMDTYLTKRDLMTPSLRRAVSIMAILCYFLASALAFTVFSGQLAAYDWFTTLLVPG